MESQTMITILRQKQKAQLVLLHHVLDIQTPIQYNPVSIWAQQLPAGKLGEGSLL